MEIAWRLPARLGLASSRRPLLVVLTIACALGIGHVLAGSDGSPEEQRLLLGVHTSLVAIVLAAAAIDLDHMILPNALTLGGAALALATAPLRAVGLGGAALGAAVGLALTVLPFLLYKRLRGRSGMGRGDAMLAIFAGAWLGEQGVRAVVFLGAVQNVLGAVLLRALGRAYPIPVSVVAELDALRARAANGDAEAAAELADDPMSAAVEGGVLTTRLPLGPFLALACVEVLFARRWLIQHVFAWIAG